MKNVLFLNFYIKYENINKTNKKREKSSTHFLSEARITLRKY